MNIRELRDKLDDWGDHLEVAVVIYKDEDEIVKKDFELDDRMTSEGLRVELAVEL